MTLSFVHGEQLDGRINLICSSLDSEGLEEASLESEFERERFEPEQEGASISLWSSSALIGEKDDPNRQ